MDPNLRKFIEVAREDVLRGRMMPDDVWDRATVHAHHYLEMLDPAVSPQPGVEFNKFKARLKEAIDGVI